MRLLIASVNHEHVNSMHINYYQALSEAAEVDFYGPGLSADRELEQGIVKFMEKHGPYDAVLVAFPLMMSSMKLAAIREAYQYHRYIMADYSVAQAVRYADSIVNGVEQLKLPRLIIFGQDYINISEAWRDYLKERLEKGFYIVSPGSEFIPEADGEERTFGEQLSINDRYKLLIEEYRERNISIPFIAAGCGDYFFASLEKREYDWVVPGNIDGCYPNRGKVLRTLKQNGYKVYDRFIDRTMVYKTDEARSDRCDYARPEERYVDSRLGKSTPYLRNNLKREEIVRWRENYNVSLRRAKAAYADGGEGRSLVRKYIEIPARGTLLVCERVKGLECLGFKDGENMITAVPETILDISRQLFDNIDEMQRIADNGRRLVIHKHTSRNRAENTVKAIQSILSARYCGSHWENGDFKIEE